MTELTVESVGKDIERDVLFCLAHEMINGPYKIEGSGVPITYPEFSTIPITDTIVVYVKNKEGKTVPRTEAIRYIAECQSILVSEQKEQGYDVDRPAADEDCIIFWRGQLPVDGLLKSNLLAYLNATNCNKDNPNRRKEMGFVFKRDDSWKKVIKGLDLEERITRAKNIVFNLSEGELKQLCAIMPEFKTEGKGRIEMLQPLLNLAQAKPELITEGFGGKKLEVKSLIMEANHLSVIVDIGKKIHYMSEEKKPVGSALFSLPENIKKSELVDRFSDFLMSEEGRLVYLQIKENVTKAKDAINKAE